MSSELEAAQAKIASDAQEYIKLAQQYAETLVQLEVARAEVLAAKKLVFDISVEHSDRVRALRGVVGAAKALVKNGTNIEMVNLRHAVAALAAKES